jgi:hypothetical protein
MLRKSQALKKIEEEVTGNGDEPETREVDAPGENSDSQ